MSHYTVPTSRKIVAHCPSKQDTEVYDKGAHTHSLTDPGSVCVVALIHLRKKKAKLL